MRISAVQNCNYTSSKNSNPTSVNKSLSFGELHFSQPLRNYCRSNAISIETLKKAKKNTKPISKKVFDRWLNYIKERMFASPHKSDIIATVCSAISKEFYGIDNNKEIMALAQCEQLSAIYEKYVEQLEQQASGIFTGEGEDFDYNVEQKADYCGSNPKICYNVPGFCIMSYQYTPGGMTYGITHSLEYVNDARPGALFFVNEPEEDDSSSELVKNLVNTAKQIQKDYRSEIEQVIRPLAEQIIANDDYENLK